MRVEPPLAARLRLEGLDWIAPDWPAPATVRAVSTTRNGLCGSAVDFARQRPDATARALLHRFVPREPLWLAQTHGTLVASADVRYDHAPEADGAVSRIPGNICAVLSADCLPVIFSDRRGTVVAAAHAGWRGLAGGVLEATIDAMGTDPADVLAWLGPAIGPRAFEVGADVHAAFCGRDGGARACFVATRPGKWLADLYTLATRALVRTGVHAGAIYGGGRCTFHEPAAFYSYRRGGPERDARMATLIWLASG